MRGLTAFDTMISRPPSSLIVSSTTLTQSASRPISYHRLLTPFHAYQPKLRKHASTHPLNSARLNPKLLPQCLCNILRRGLARHVVDGDITALPRELLADDRAEPAVSAS